MKQSWGKGHTMLLSPEGPFTTNTMFLSFVIVIQTIALAAALASVVAARINELDRLIQRIAQGTAVFLFIGELLTWFTNGNGCVVSVFFFLVLVGIGVFVMVDFDKL